MPDYDYFERLERERLMRESSSSQETDSYLEDEEEYEENETEFITEEEMRQAAIKEVEGYTGINTNNYNNTSNTNTRTSEVNHMDNLNNKNLQSSGPMIGFDINDPFFKSIIDYVPDDQKLAQVDTTTEEIPEEAPSQQMEAPSSEVSALEQSEMTASLQYIRANMTDKRKGLDKLDKDLYINKKDIIEVNNKYFKDKAELTAKYNGNEKRAKEEALKMKNEALDNLCRNAKKFDKDSFKEMQLMAGKQSKDFDIIHFSKDKDGNPQLSNVRISGHSMTAKQLKNQKDAASKSDTHKRGVEKNVGGISHNSRSFLGGDAQSQFTATIMIGADILLAAIHEMMKKANDARLWNIERQIKKQIEIGNDNLINFDEIEAQVNEEFEQTQNQIKDEQTSEKSEDVKDEEIQEDNDKEPTDNQPETVEDIMEEDERNNEELPEQDSNEIALTDKEEPIVEEEREETIDDMFNEDGEKVSDEALADTDLEPGESKEEEEREDESIDDIYLDEERINSSESANNSQTAIEDAFDKDNDGDIDLDDMLR